MNKETPQELIERIGYNEFYRYYMEKQYYIEELQQKIDDLESLIELLYYKIELNDEQQKLLDQILGDKENEKNK